MNTIFTRTITKDTGSETWELALNLETTRYGWVSQSGCVLAWFETCEGALKSDIFEKLAKPSTERIDIIRDLHK